MWIYFVYEFVDLGLKLYVQIPENITLLVSTVQLVCLRGKVRYVQFPRSMAPKFHFKKLCVIRFSYDSIVFAINRRVLNNFLRINNANNSTRKLW